MATEMMTINAALLATQVNENSLLALIIALILGLIDWFLRKYPTYKYASLLNYIKLFIQWLDSIIDRKVKNKVVDKVTRREFIHAVYQNMLNEENEKVINSVDTLKKTYVKDLDFETRTMYNILAKNLKLRPYDGSN